MGIDKYKWYIALFLVVGVLASYVVATGAETLGLASGRKNSCSDTDGGIVITVFGQTYGYLNKTYYIHNDTCVNSGTVKEYYCNGTLEKNVQRSCGNDTYVGGNYCLNGSVYRNFLDYSCALGVCSSTTSPRLQQTCQYGCVNGTCSPPYNSCSDTDGGIVPKFAGAVYGYTGGSPYSYNDTCVTNTTLREWYCSGTAAYNLSMSCLNATINSTICLSGLCM